MRYTEVVGKQDKVNFTIYGCPSLIHEIMVMGKCVGDLIYEVELTGAQLLERFRFDPKKTADVLPDHIYVLTAYDW